MYKASKTLAPLKRLQRLKVPITDFTNKLEQTKRTGLHADATNNESDKRAYLKALRSLQRDHEKIMALSTRILLDAMHRDDYQAFLALIGAGIEHYRLKKTLNKQIISYYQKHKHLGRNTVLERIVKDERNMVKQYVRPNQTASYSTSNQKRKQKKILSSAKTKNQDKKRCSAKSPRMPLLHSRKTAIKSHGAAFTEYNVRKAKGAALFGKHNGKGVPVLIIGNTIVHGYSKSAILNVLNL